MDSFKESKRQIINALVLILMVTTIGVVGFAFFEKLGPLDALYLTVITLTTVGYGDEVARTEIGRAFTMLLVLGGFGVVAYGLQATATFLVSPEILNLRQKLHTLKTIRRLENHYIICGNGPVVDQTIAYLLQSVQMRLAFYDEALYGPVDNFLDRIFGDDELGHYPRARAVVRRIYLSSTRPFQRVGTLLDLIVVITEDEHYAHKLRDKGFFVIEGSPKYEATLQDAGVERAKAIMVTLAEENETLLTVLTARDMNPNLYITATAEREDLAEKILRVGANQVISPFELAGKFLNNLTLRPAVYDFFNGILFDHTLDVQSTQITLKQGAPWIGKRVRELSLNDRFDAAVLGICGTDGGYIVAPSDSYVLGEGEDLIVIAPSRSISAIKDEAVIGTNTAVKIQDHHPPTTVNPKQADKVYTLEEAEAAIAGMEKHFIICGDDSVAYHAVMQLDPTRPFVVVSQQDDHVEKLLSRGFRVIKGDPTRDETLLRAKADTALAVMISLEDDADTVLTVISARAISNQLLITATADVDETVRKLERAGADRVISPYNIAAQVILLATTRPIVSGFFTYVLYNEDAGIETTELYMQDNSSWIGKTIGDLRLERLFRAHVIAIRQPDGKFTYTPPSERAIKAHEVLIIVTPMVHADELRLAAHGDEAKRPDTLRRTDVITTIVGRNPLLE